MSYRPPTEPVISSDVNPVLDSYLPAPAPRRTVLRVSPSQKKSDAVHAVVGALSGSSSLLFLDLPATAVAQASLDTVAAALELNQSLL